MWSGYKSAVGPIPDEWFENDTGPDEKYKKTHPAGFLEGFLKGLAPEDSTPHARPEQPERSRPVSATARTTIPDGE
jgi:hypothetical protein